MPPTCFFVCLLLFIIFIIKGLLESWGTGEGALPPSALGHKDKKLTREDIGDPNVLPNELIKPIHDRMPVILSRYCSFLFFYATLYPKIKEHGYP